MTSRRRKGRWPYGETKSATLSPAQYEVAVWVGRGFSDKRIALQIGEPLEKVRRLIHSAMRIKGRSRRELAELFEPDWDSIDSDEVSRWQPALKVGRPKKKARKSRKKLKDQGAI